MSSAETLRICSRCGESKPANAEHFYKDKNRSGGLSSRCKPCARAVTKEWKLANPQRWAEYRAKPDPNREDHLAARNERAKLHYKANAEKEREYRRVYRAKNRETIKARNDRWWPEYAAAHPELVREQRAQTNHRRRAQMLGTAVGPIDYDALWEEHKGVCHICLDALERKEVWWDHIVPLARGGTHTQDNLAPSHRLCNIRKGARLPVTTL